jgi:hypothetical protein
LVQEGQTCLPCSVFAETTPWATKWYYQVPDEEEFMVWLQTVLSVSCQHSTCFSKQFKQITNLLTSIMEGWWTSTLMVLLKDHSLVSIELSNNNWMASNGARGGKHSAVAIIFLAHGHPPNILLWWGLLLVDPSLGMLPIKSLTFSMTAEVIVCLSSKKAHQWQPTYHIACKASIPICWFIWVAVKWQTWQLMLFSHALGASPQATFWLYIYIYIQTCMTDLSWLLDHWPLGMVPHITWHIAQSLLMKWKQKSLLFIVLIGT